MRGLLNFFLTFCISLAVLFPSDSSALGTNKPSDIKFGVTMDSNPQPVGLTAPAQCNFSVYNDPTTGVTEADVTIFSGGTAGGSKFAYGGGIDTGTPAITAADILAFCPFVAGSVTIVSQNGADGSYASDTYIGITYTAQPTGDTNFYTYSTGMQVVGGLTEVFNTREILVANTAPTANAGPDANAASAASVTLNGAGSSANDAGQTLTYAWSQTSGTAVTLSDATAAAPTFTAPTLAIGAADVPLTFELIVNDGIDPSTADSVIITVQATQNNVKPNVVLSGLPAFHDGTSAFSLAATFSESVSGFAIGDLDVQHGIATLVSGSGASYIVTISPESTVKAVSVRVKANVVQNAAGTRNTSSETVRINANIVSVARREIAKSSLQRGRLLVRAQPTLSRFFETGGGGLEANGTATRADLNFSTAMDRRVWANAMGLWSNEDGDKQSYAHLSFGSHLVMTNTLIVGAMVQFDQSTTTFDDGKIDSHGYLVGPYVVAKLAEQPLIFSASLLRGSSENMLTLTDLTTDHFKSTRTLATFGVEGSVDLGNDLRMMPSVDFLYLLDQQHAYIDGANNTVFEQETELTSATLGLGFEFPLTVTFENVLMNTGVNATFEKTKTDIGTDESLRWGVDLGAVMQLSHGGTISVDLIYDGLGSSNSESYGGNVTYELTF